MHILEIRGRDFYLDGKRQLSAQERFIISESCPNTGRTDCLNSKPRGLTPSKPMSRGTCTSQKGEFNFDGILDIVRFVKTAEKIGLNVIVRPGPYICAEWDFGGFPAWLLKDENIRLRCGDKKYLKAVTDYFNVLLPMLAPLQKTKDGPIIAMQIENEYGSFGNDKNYLSYSAGLCAQTALMCCFSPPTATTVTISRAAVLRELMVTTQFNARRLL